MGIIIIFLKSKDYSSYAYLHFSIILPLLAIVENKYFHWRCCVMLNLGKGSLLHVHFSALRELSYNQHLVIFLIVKCLY